VTCSGHGYCIQNQNETKCKCLVGYEGENCEIESNAVKYVKGIQWTTTIVALVFLVTFWIIVISNDALNYFKACNERIDIGEWKREKIFGKKQKNKHKKETKKKLEKS